MTDENKQKNWFARHKILTGLGGAVVLFSVIGIATSGGNDANQPATPVANHAVPAPQANAAPEQKDNAPAPESVDPLTHDGTWIVGSEIQPGTYRATAAKGQFISMGYWARCADAACLIDMDGDDSTGLIQNGNVTGSDLISIQPSDYAVQLRDLVLTPVN